MLSALRAARAGYLRSAGPLGPGVFHSCGPLGPRRGAILRARGPRERAAAAARASLATADQLGAEPLGEQLAQHGRVDLAEPPETAAPVVDTYADLGVSRREAEVLGLLALGRTNRQIAEELFISEKTASFHFTHFLRKLGVTSRIQAAAVAQRHGLGA